MMTTRRKIGEQCNYSADPGDVKPIKVRTMREVAEHG